MTPQTLEPQEKAAAEQDPDHDADYRKAARRRWARLIKKVYEVDPLICPNRRAWKCGGKMSVIAFIEDATTIRKILEHIGEYSPPERAPPKGGGYISPQDALSEAASEWEYVPAEHVA